MSTSEVLDKYVDQLASYDRVDTKISLLLQEKQIQDPDLFLGWEIYLVLKQHGRENLKHLILL